MCIKANTEGSSEVNDKLIDRFRVPSLKVRHLFERYMEYLGRGDAVNIFLLFVCVDELFITGAVRQDAQFYLGIVGVDKHISVLWDKHLADQPAKLHPNRDVLQVRLRAADPSGRGNRLVELAVDSPILVNIINYVDVNFKIDERTGRIIMMGAMDNLVKGAAGQAVQNMNLMFGLPEDEGLAFVPLFP